MRKIRDVLRLRHAEHLSTRAIAAATRLPRTTVRHYLDRASEAGLSWPLPAETDDRELEERLFGRAAPPPLSSARPVPDWEMVHREMHRPHVTLQLLWPLCRHRHKVHYAERVIMPTRRLPRVRAARSHAA
jgi:transposase